MKLIEAVKQTNSDYAIVMANGYEEGRFMPVFQPFSKTRKIKFTINHFIDNDGLEWYYLDNSTFIISQDDEDSEDWYIEDGVPIIFVDELFYFND